MNQPPPVNQTQNTQHPQNVHNVYAQQNQFQRYFPQPPNLAFANPNQPQQVN